MVPPANGSVELAVPFLVPPDPHSLETRVWFLGQGTFRIDRVSVVTK